MDTAAVAAAHADGGNFYAVALGLAAGDFGNVHGHGYGGEPAHAHVVEDVFEAGVFAAEVVEIALLEVFGEQEFLGQQGGEGTLQQLFAQAHGIAAVDIFEFVADGAAGAAGNHEVEPGRIGAGGVGSDDFHAVAGTQAGAQGNHVVVDTGGNAAVADVGVHGIGEIHRRGAFGQHEDFAFRREYIHFARE